MRGTALVAFYFVFKYLLPMYIDNKEKLRSELREKRRLFVQNSKTASFFQDIGPFFRHFLQKTLNLPKTSVISGYWPLRDEADCKPLLTSLFQYGFPCALPCIDALKSPLSFRSWHPLDVLTKSPCMTISDLFQPRKNQPLVRPTLLLIPFLGVDKYGNRLGYGGGFYDRTLHLLRKSPKDSVIAVGVGFSIQEIDHVPTTPEDEPLNWILTEHGLQKASS
ncbi:MAG: 5-formyltetrahydrofolate cyclo-ligase [Proteobacteria bacterium]|nr:5-formyltetrahydrofolate cyclo-ligase [Pseudomonadota bacterium]